MAGSPEALARIELAQSERNVLGIGPRMVRFEPCWERLAGPFGLPCVGPAPECPESSVGFCRTP